MGTRVTSEKKKRREEKREERQGEGREGRVGKRDEDKGAGREDGSGKREGTGRRRTGRNDNKSGEIKSGTGVICFLQGIGFSHADVPLEEGKRTVHKLSSEEMAASRA